MFNVKCVGFIAVLALCSTTLCAQTPAQPPAKIKTDTALLTRTDTALRTRTDTATKSIPRRRVKKVNPNSKAAKAAQTNSKTISDGPAANVPAPNCGSSGGG